MNIQLKNFTVLAVAIALTGTAHSQLSGKFINPADRDITVKPGDDFYRYANGTWVKNNPVPAKETRWGSFNILRDFNVNAVKSILDRAASNKDAAAGSVERRVGDFYAAAMDSLAIEKQGFLPVKNVLATINAVETIEGVVNEAAVLRTQGYGSPLYGFFIGQDRTNVEKMMAQFSQGGTTLPDRDYYLKDDPRSLSIRKAYQEYIYQLFALIGTPAAEAKSNADVIIGIEKKLAEAQMSRVEMRDPYKTYNKFTVNDFSRQTPGINWSETLKTLGVTGQDSVLVNNPSFFAAVANLLQSINVNDWKTYLKWNVLGNAAPYLSNSFTTAHFSYNQVISGQRVQTPRWEQMSNLTDRTIGELLGQLYVKEYFKPEAKERMNILVENLRKAFEIRIKGLDWMSDVTKQKALAKLAAFRPKVGYPNKWQNYDGLVIMPNAFFENVRNGSIWRYRDMIGRLGKPVDRERFGMTPPTVNAYYSATLNEIVFPAGILQFPFFDPNADDAVNFGGIGAVIGHEMSHGFDDQGSKYDADGTMRNWWTDKDRKLFDAKAQKLVEQYNKYTVLDSVHVNGKLTLGENIGDLGGLNVAYEAFKMTKQGKGKKKINGFTPDQRFFLSWAQVWRGNILPEEAAQRILTDPHSPGPYRTIGPLVNMDAWYNAFNVTPGNNLYVKPENRIRIW